MFKINLILILAVLAQLPVSPAASAYSDDYPSVLIADVPHILQKEDFCGEACIAMFLKKLKVDVDQDDVFNASGLDPIEGRGMRTGEMADILKKIGFEPGQVWAWVRVDHLDLDLKQQWRQLYDDLAKGIPSIVCMRFDPTEGANEHFRLLIGYDSKTDEVIYHEPAQGNGASLRMPRQTFFSLWPLKYKPDRWLVIRLRLAAGAIKIKKYPKGSSDADYCQHIMALRKKVPQGFSVFIQKPFVVLGDGDPAMLEENYVLGTVKRSSQAYKAMYFKNDPSRIIDVWLFKDDLSYNRYSAKLFGDSPDTPFGYYSPQGNALVMNISTGGGTLVHEMFHAFISGNFPQCPAWFNEGYASLYEQSQFGDNAIFGLTNWRLAELQNGIRHNELLSFQEFCSQDSRQFYNGSRHNYAQARYLALYLQAKSLLVRYYQAFYKNRKTDPTGYQTLKAILGEPDMDAFQKQWEKWVLGLSFPPSYLPAGEAGAPDESMPASPAR